MTSNDESELPENDEDSVLEFENHGKFSTPLKTLYLETLNYQRSHVLESDDNKGTRFKTFLSGTLTAQRDKGFGVIGDEDTYSKEISFTLRPADTSHHRKNVIKHFGKRRFDQEEGLVIHTCATIGFSYADYECGTTDEWWVELEISHEVFEDILNRAELGPLKILFGLTMQKIYSDNLWADPETQIRWFLAPQQKGFPGTSHGYISLMRVDERPITVEEREQL